MAVFDGSPERQTDEWWVNRLEQAIQHRNRGQFGGVSWSSQEIANDRRTRPGLYLLEAWFRGEPPMPEAYDEAWADRWKKFIRTARTNYAELVISSVTDRLVPIGWTTGAEDDSDGDQVAAEVAAETNLMVEGGDAISDMLVHADGYLLVGEKDGQPLITAESPMQTITAETPAGPLAGLRIATDEWTGDREFWLYRPGKVRTARRLRRDGKYELTEPASIPGGAFPLVNLRNRRGVGDFERHLDALWRINDSMFNRLVLTKLQAHRQRAIERAEQGEDADEIVLDPNDFLSGPDALWDLPAGAKIWESQSADLNPVRAMVLDDVKHLCAVTGTPLADAVPDGANQSAKGSQLVEDKTIFRILDRQRRADRGLARALALAFSVKGDAARADATKIRTLWAPVVRHSLVDMGQAASQLAGIMPRDWIALNVLQERPGNLPAVQRMRLADMLTDPEAGGSGGAVA